MNRFVKPLLFTCLLLLACGTTVAQIPEEFKNLQVLPKDTDPRQLVQMMRGFASALGTRCWGCHVGEEGMPLSQFDFASDAKPEKKIAREMLKMLREINATLGKIDLEHEPALEVSCATCHHGLKRPQPIEDILRERYESGGVDAALARYEELRKEYYGGYQYDFGQGPLNTWSEGLVRAGKLDDALKVQLLNAQYHPDADYVQFTLGQIYTQKGDKEKATAYFQKALELSPGNEFYKRALSGSPTP